MNQEWVMVGFDEKEWAKVGLDVSGVGERWGWMTQYLVKVGLDDSVFSEGEVG